MVYHTWCGDFPSPTSTPSRPYAPMIFHRIHRMVAWLASAWYLEWTVIPNDRLFKWKRIFFYWLKTNQFFLKRVGFTLRVWVRLKFTYELTNLRTVVSCWQCFLNDRPSKPSPHWTTIHQLDHYQKVSHTEFIFSNVVITECGLFTFNREFPRTRKSLVGLKPISFCFVKNTNFMKTILQFSSIITSIWQYHVYRSCRQPTLTSYLLEQIWAFKC